MDDREILDALQKKAIAEGRDPATVQVGATQEQLEKHREVLHENAILDQQWKERSVVEDVHQQSQPVSAESPDPGTALEGGETEVESPGESSGIVEETTSDGEVLQEPPSGAVADEAATPDSPPEETVPFDTVEETIPSSTEETAPEEVTSDLGSEASESTAEPLPEAEGSDLVSHPGGV